MSPRPPIVPSRSDVFDPSAPPKESMVITPPPPLRRGCNVAEVRVRVWCGFEGARSRRRARKASHSNPPAASTGRLRHQLGPPEKRGVVVRSVVAFEHGHKIEVECELVLLVSNLNGFVVPQS